MNQRPGQPDSDASVRNWETEDHEPGTFRLSAEGSDAPGRVVTPSGSLYFLNVSGSPEEMGRETGRRLSAILPDGPVPFYASFLNRALTGPEGSRKSGLLRWLTERLATDHLLESYTGEVRKMVEGLAATTPLSAHSILEAHTLPDTLLWIVGTADRYIGGDRVPGLNRPILGACTSAVVRPPTSHRLLHAYNYDFFGVGPWESAATVQFYHPDDSLDYVTATSAGLLGGGRAAMNAAGLTLTVHRHAVDRFDLEGATADVAGDRVMRGARNIDEAIDILRDHPPVGGSSYLLTEGDTGEVALFEAAPTMESVHRLPQDESSFGHTNCFRDASFDSLAIDGHPEYRRTLRGRQIRVRELVADVDRDADVDARRIAAVLGDFVDASDGRQRLVGRTVASVQTISSVVFEPSLRRVWVGAGSSPTSRSWFVPFDMAGTRGAEQGGPNPDCAPFHPSVGWSRSSHGQAFKLYRDACMRQFQGESDKRLLIVLEHALALFPEDPSLHILGGLLALRMGRPRRAEGAFRRALERINELPRRAEATLYLAWALDLQEQRSSARQMYRRVLHMQSADSGVTRRARKGRWFAFSPKKAEQLTIDFVHAAAL